MLLGNFLLPLLSKLSEGKVHFNEVVTDSYNKVRACNR